ncbi:putative MFS transporter family protein [Bisporella sp. PMI_857]|nr:putative MFS transporter family protein [Bisporella sp. PMI_857]
MIGRRAPRYEGEDVSETTDRELRGWYAYGLAAEVFAVCGVGSFLPVTLEQLARENGVKWTDRTVPCTVKPAVEDDVINATLKGLLKRATDRTNQCVIKPLGFEITTASFAMYTFSAAVFIQALALVSFSSVADHGAYRKKLLIAFGFVGATTSMLFLLVVPSIYLIGPILVVIGVTCLGSSFVLLNSFLPLLVLNHPNTETSESIPLETLAQNDGHQSPEDDEDVVVISGVSPPKDDSSDLRLSSKISSKGVGIGYMAAVFVQILSIILLFLMSKTKSVSSTLPLRMVLFLVGLWWFVFTIPSSMWLRTRPGPPLNTVFSRRGRWLNLWRYGAFAWGSLWKTVKVAAKLRQVVVFLIAWFLLSDAMATVSGTAILFARTELKMGTVAIALVSITATASGISGAFLWPIFSRRFGLRTNQTIAACIVLLEVIPFYGLLGYLPFIQSWGVGGLQKAWEIYPLAFIHGLVMGGLSSYCRSFFGRLIPPGSEAAFYALYAITDKGSSAVGPAVVGWIIDKTGHIRPAFIFLAVLIALPGPLIWLVDVHKGQEDALQMSKVLKRSRSGQENLDYRNESGQQEAEGLMRDHE